MSKKAPPPQAVARFRAQLTADGDPDAGSADIQWARRTLQGEQATPPGEALRPEVAFALVEELVATRQAELLSRLAASSHKLVAKAARTGVHRLRSKRVEVELPPDGAGEEHAGTGLAMQQGIPSVVSIYDGRWERLVWVGLEATGGVTVYQARISALYGLLELRTGDTTRSELRRTTRKIRQELGGATVDEREGVWFIRDAARRCEQAGRSMPEGFARHSQGLPGHPGGAHPAEALEPHDVDLIELYDLAELRYWGPDPQFLRRLSLRLDEIATSQLVINDQQRRMQADAAVERALAEYLTPARCASSRVLLLDTAHLLAATSRAREASRLRAAASLFELPAEELARHPFARELVRRRLPDTQAPARPEEPDPGPGGLIVPGR